MSSSERGSVARKSILVAGDGIIDWNLAHPTGDPNREAAWSLGDLAVRVHAQQGGALLTARLLEELLARAEPGGQVRFHGRRPPERVEPTDRSLHHFYTLWTERERTGGAGPRRAWRVQSFLGLERGRPPVEPPPVAAGGEESELAVLVDSGLDFRCFEPGWPDFLRKGSARPWVVLKMATPVASGPLWERLLERHRERLVVLVTATELRHEDVQISRALSWERTTHDILEALAGDSALATLARCAHLVVTLPMAGAVLVSGARVSLCFDPRTVEGHWERNHPGLMLGYSSVLAAAVASATLRASATPDRLHDELGAALARALAAMRVLHDEGYAGGEEGRPSFPHPRMAELLAAPDGRSPEFQTVPVVREEARAAGWTLLSTTLRRRGAREGDAAMREALRALAMEIALRGHEEALAEVPVGQLGNLLTADRREIEALRSVQGLMAEFCRQARRRPLLAIAVFGPPGSGKSFSVEEVARSVRVSELEMKKFNLSQFTSSQELLGAFHQVRDMALAGRIPLVFWDEFDSPLASAPLGWLRYFLAPVQDGEFQEGQVTHALGKCIFVFAGGTCSTMAHFLERARELPDA